MLRNQTPAPDFTLPDETGRDRSLAEMRAGKILVLLFLRFADCPTTRRDLLTYADVYGRIRSLGGEMVAITADTVEAHRALRECLQLPYSLLSDSGLHVSDRYHIYASDETDEGPQPHGEPAVFVIDIDGNMAYSQVSTGPKGIASPSEIALMLVYMSQNGGMYW
jgi:peroxiredoxin